MSRETFAKAALTFAVLAVVAFVAVAVITTGRKALSPVKAGDVWEYIYDPNPGVRAGSPFGDECEGEMTDHKKLEVVVVRFHVLEAKEGWVKYQRLGTNKVSCDPEYYFRIGAKRVAEAQP